jgi:hypothetical protein
MAACAWCRRILSPGQERRIPGWIGYVAAVAMAFAHAGMWAKEGLSLPYCSRCRARLIPLVLGGAALVLSIAVAGAVFFVRGPR